MGIYDVFEIAYEITHTVPATDEEKSSLDFRATFTSPTGKQIIIPGFWAGENYWKVRFAPTRLGKWTSVTSSSSLELQNLTGSVISVPSDNKGFITVSEKSIHIPIFGWHAVLHVGTYRLSSSPDGVGKTGSSHLSIHNPDDPTIKHTMKTTDWHEFVDKAQEYGMNKIRFLVTMWNWGNDFGTRWFPWENSSVTNPQFEAFNQSYWEKLDEMVQYMQEKGMIAELILFPDYANWAADDPGMYNMTPADQQLYMKFATARYSAYSNVIWVMANRILLQ